MASAEEKIAALVRRALGTDSEEEARTSALLALKLAAKSGAVIRVTRAGEAEVEASRPSPRSREESKAKRRGPAYRRQAGEKQGASFKNFFADDEGECDHCGGTWEVGRMIARRDGDPGTYHAECAAQRR